MASMPGFDLWRFTAGGFPLRDEKRPNAGQPILPEGIIVKISENFLIGGIRQWISL